MPPHLAPTRSGVHRLACLSLYHALLAQSSRSFARSGKADQIQEFIKMRFRKDKKLYSITRIANALKAGHEALELFQSCARGDKESIQRVDSLLTVTQARWQKVLEERRAQTARRPPSTPAAKERLARRSEAANSNPVRRAILLRPYPKVSGRRHVPVLVSARGLPFLRTQKPQPRKLSDTIRGLLNHRWRRMKTRMALERELQTALHEDAWDARTGQREGPSWASTVQENLDEVNYKIIKQDNENKILAQQMWDVVLRERELVKKEAMERKAEKMARGLAEKETEANEEKKND